jgi:hypothetical protein
MAEDGITYSEAVRVAAAEAAAALGTNSEALRAAPALGTLPEGVRQPAPRTRRNPGNSGMAHVLLDVDAEKEKPAPCRRPDMQSADSRTIASLEACVSDLRSMLAKAEERSSDERARCDRLTAEAMSANVRAAHIEGELTALRSSITILETCVSDLRSMLAKAEERSSEERARCDRLTAEAMSANARAAQLEGELTALRSYRPWRQRLIALAALAPWPPMRRRSPAGPQ